MKNLASVHLSGLGLPGQAQGSGENGATGQMKAYDYSTSFTSPTRVEAQVNLKAAHTPRQLISDEIADAFAAGEITLTAADKVYGCLVVGPGHKGERA
jgi:hypothetical protein